MRTATVRTEVSNKKRRDVGEKDGTAAHYENYKNRVKVNSFGVSKSITIIVTQTLSRAPAMTTVRSFDLGSTEKPTPFEIFSPL